MNTTAELHKKLAHVPFMQKDQFKATCKEHGILYQYNKETKSWHVRVSETDDLEPIKKWLAAPSIQIDKVIPAFKSHLEQYGLLIDEPIMDGELHRCAVHGGKSGAQDGSYVGYLDGRPSGWVRNYKTGGESKWKFEGIELTAEQVSTIKKEAVDKQEKRKNDNAEKQKERIQKLQQFFSTGEHGKADSHYYATTKKIHCDPKILIDANGNLIIPIIDINRKLQSSQQITPSGQKRYATGLSKSGNFFIASPPGKSMTDFFNEVQNQNEIYFAEGYATAATIAKAMNVYVVVTFDSGNFPIVAENIAKKFHTQNFIHCADNDKNLPCNVGLIAAEQAAKKTRGIVVKPDMGDGEQLGTDFNDLYIAKGGNNDALELVKNQISTQIKKQLKTLESESNSQSLSM